MNAVFTAGFCLSMIGLCLFAMYTLVREMRSVRDHEQATWELWRKRVELSRLVQEERERAEYWDAADQMIAGTR